MNLNGLIEYEPPFKLIFNFEGLLTAKNNEENIFKEVLGLKNAMWANTVVAN